MTIPFIATVTIARRFFCESYRLWEQDLTYLQMSNENIPACLGYIVDYTIQLCGDFFRGSNDAAIPCLLLLTQTSKHLLKRYLGPKNIPKTSLNTFSGGVWMSRVSKVSRILALLLETCGRWRSVCLSP